MKIDQKKTRPERLREKINGRKDYQEGLHK